MLTESDRRVSFYDGSIACDNSLTEGWYRFGSPAGTQMITSPPANFGKQNRCKTHAGGWLNGAHPSVGDGEVVRQVCFAYSGNQCYFTTNAKVINCGSYYVYYLYPVRSCYSRYCGNYWCTCNGFFRTHRSYHSLTSFLAKANSHFRENLTWKNWLLYSKWISYCSQIASICFWTVFFMKSDSVLP